MHASLCAVGLSRRCESVIVNLGIRGLRSRQLIQPFLLHPVQIGIVLCCVFFEDALKRLEPLSLRQPALPVYFEVLLAFAHDLLLCTDGRVQPAQKTLIVLPVRRTYRRRDRAFFRVIVPKCIELTQTIKLFIKMLPGSAGDLTEATFLRRSQRGYLADLSASALQITGSAAPDPPAARRAPRRKARAAV